MSLPVRPSTFAYRVTDRLDRAIGAFVDFTARHVHWIALASILGLMLLVSTEEGNGEFAQEQERTRAEQERALIEAHRSAALSMPVERP